MSTGTLERINLALPVLLMCRDPILNGLVLIYTLNDTQIHRGRVPTWFKYWGSTVVVILAVYFTWRYFSLPDQQSAEWRLGVSIFMVWILVELLFSLRVGWYVHQQPGGKKRCYEPIVHTTIWLSMITLLLLHPKLREFPVNHTG